MRKIRAVLGCLLDQKLSQRKTALYTRVNRETIAEILIRFKKSGLPWPLPEIDDDALEFALYEPVSKRGRAAISDIDFSAMVEELKLPGVTLTTLHEEWAAITPNEQLVGYSQFCRRFERFQESLQISMRRIDTYGEVAYVDYSGKTAKFTDPTTGITHDVQIFVGVLGGSGYTYCEATLTQNLRDWIDSHVRMFAFFGGVPRVVVPDNLKSAVSKADRFSPVINASYNGMCSHYGTYVIPARVGEPRDKAKGEGGVLLMQRYVLAKMRKRQFFSLDEVNEAIAGYRQELNAKKFQKLAGSRFSRWLEFERPVLLPLPSEQYEFTEWGKARAGRDYHVKVDHHSYSVPHEFRGEEFEYRLTSTKVSFLRRGKCVATHIRSFVRDGTTTDPKHRHPSHKPLMEWSEDAAMSWAENLGPNVAALLKIHLSRNPGYHGGYRATEGMRSLSKRYTVEELDAACSYALAYKIFGASDLRGILFKQLYKLLSMDLEGKSSSLTTDHENIRGSSHYEQLIKAAGGGNHDA